MRCLRRRSRRRPSTRRCRRRRSAPHDRCMRPRCLHNRPRATRRPVVPSPLHGRTRRARPMTAPSGTIRVGVGGWVFPPWRSNFYPAGAGAEERARVRQPPAHGDRDQRHLPSPAEADELRQVARRHAAGLRLQRQGLAVRHQPARPRRGGRGDRAASWPAAWRSWGPSSVRSSGSSPPPRSSIRSTSKPSSKLLPGKIGSQPVRHAVEVRHPSFMTAEFLALVRRYGVATVFADSDKYPSFADPSGDFFYARLMRTESRHDDGLSAGADPLLDRGGAALGAGARPSPNCRGSRRRRPGCRRATCTPSSSAVPRNAPPEPRRRCSADWATSRR